MTKTEEINWKRKNRHSFKKASLFSYLKDPRECWQRFCEEEKEGDDQCAEHGPLDCELWGGLLLLLLLIIAIVIFIIINPHLEECQSSFLRTGWEG